jgi:hypothetical protein
MLVGGRLRCCSYCVVLKRLVFSVFSGVFAVPAVLQGVFSLCCLDALLQLVPVSFGSTIFVRVGEEGYFCLPSLVQRK